MTSLAAAGAGGRAAAPIVPIMTPVISTSAAVPFLTSRYALQKPGRPVPAERPSEICSRPPLQTLQDDVSHVQADDRARLDV